MAKTTKCVRRETKYEREEKRIAATGALAMVSCARAFTSHEQSGALLHALVTVAAQFDRRCWVEGTKKGAARTLPDRARYALMGLGLLADRFPQHLKYMAEVVMTTVGVMMDSLEKKGDKRLAGAPAEAARS